MMHLIVWHAIYLVQTWWFSFDSIIDELKNIKVQRTILNMCDFLLVTIILNYILIFICSI